MYIKRVNYKVTIKLYYRNHHKDDEKTGHQSKEDIFKHITNDQVILYNCMKKYLISLINMF